jgi:translation initiation factor 2A
MLWNPCGGSLLVHTQSEVDTTGKSYMGATGLYYLPLEGKKVQNVTLRKEGPIHDVQWSPLGDEFVCIYGVSPPEAAIFNLKCELTHSFGEAPRNTVSWAPHGRFLALAGFGNMSGELSFFDRRSLKCLSTVDAHMTVNYGWSPDSRYFLTAILFPRLRVDNGFRVWSCAGGLLHEEHIEELTVAMWRPQPKSRFAPPTDADIKAHPAAAKGPAPPSKAAKYVPPGQRASGGGGRSLAELALSRGAEPGVSGGQSSGRSLSQLSAAMERGGSAAIRGGAPPGAETTDGSSSRSAAKNKAKAEAKKKKKAEEAAGGGGGGPPPATAVAAGSGGGGAAGKGGGGGGGGGNDDEETEEKITKKVRATEKKLRQITELKELKAGGKPLEKTQLSKIDAEETVRAELEALQLKLTQAGEQGKWR